MTQLTESIFAVEVPDKGRKFRVQRPHKTSPMHLYYKYGIEEQWNFIKLPPGTWQLLCTTKEATEEQAKGIVERTHPGGFGRSGEEFKNYLNHSPVCFNAVTSLRSLLASKGLDLNKNYCLLKKEK